MVTTNTGSLKASDIALQKVPVNMDEHMTYEQETAYYLEMLTRRLNGIKTTDSTKMEWMEHRLFPHVVTVDEIDVAGEVHIAVDNPEYCPRNAYLYNTRTGEHYLVNEAAFGGDLAAGKVQVLGVSGTGGIVSDTAVGDTILVGLESHAEGEAIPEGYYRAPEFQLTYIQQTDMTLKHTDIQEVSAEYGLNQMLINRKLKWIEFKKKQNLGYYLGAAQREVASSGDGRRRHMADGLDARITTNVTDFGSVPGALTVAAISTMLQNTKYRTVGNDQFIGLLGSLAYNSVSDLPDTAIRTTVDNSTWGKRLTRLKTPHGDLPIAYDPVLSAENGLADRIYMPDLSLLNRISQKGLPLRMMMNKQNATDIHNVIDVITGTHGFCVKWDEKHARGYNVA